MEQGFSDIDFVFARKFIRPSGSITRRDIENEVETISKLCHHSRSCKNVVEMLDHGWLDITQTFYFIDMEYCSETLEDRIHGLSKKTEHNNTKNSANELANMAFNTQTKPAFASSNFDSWTHEDLEESPSIELDFESVAEILEDIVSGLIYIHQHKTVHRDLKPANGTGTLLAIIVLIGIVLYSLVHNCWKLADFGCASAGTSERLNTTILGRGTNGYRAPEVLNDPGKCNTKADMFALGCIIYETVTGEKLFTSDFAIVDYARSKDESVLERWPESRPDTPLHALRNLTKELIDFNHVKRPGALMVQRRIEQIRRHAYHEIREETTVSHLPTLEPLQIHQPMKLQIQPLFWQASKRKRESSSLDPHSTKLPSDWPTSSNRGLVEMTLSPSYPVYKASSVATSSSDNSLAHTHPLASISTGLTPTISESFRNQAWKSRPGRRERFLCDQCRLAKRGYTVGIPIRE